MITTLLARITPPCKDVTHLVSQSLDRRLPWSTQLSLHVHFWICQACARYRNQLQTVREALRRSTNQDHTNESSSPSPATKTRVTEAFRAKHK